MQRMNEAPEWETCRTRIFHQIDETRVLTSFPLNVGGLADRQHTDAGQDEMSTTTQTISGERGECSC
jgi:hypothetical protein